MKIHMGKGLEDQAFRIVSNCLSVQRAMFNEYCRYYSISGHYNYAVKDEILTVHPYWSDDGILKSIGHPDKDLRKNYPVPGLKDRYGTGLLNVN